jgi:hypothetical protein
MTASAKQLEESAAMLRRMKAGLAARVTAGEDVPAGELEQVVKLEQRLATLETYQRLKALTAEPINGGGEGTQAEAAAAEGPGGQPG